MGDSQIGLIWEALKNRQKFLNRTTCWQACPKIALRCETGMMGNEMEKLEGKDCVVDKDKRARHLLTFKTDV